MKLRKIIGIAVFVIIIIIAIVVGLQPPQAHIEEDILIDAPPSVIFPEVSNYKNFTVWSPWNKLDPGVTQTFEGQEGTVGSTMHWEGPKTGTGSQKIILIEENQRVKYAMKFGGTEEEFFSEFLLTPYENGTIVRWTYDGPNRGLGAKVMWIFTGSMLSSQYRQGLRDLKEVVEQK